MPDFDSLSAGPSQNIGTAGTAGSGGAAGSGDAGSSGASGSAGNGGNGGTSGDGADAGPVGNLIQNPDFEEATLRWSPIGNCALQLVSEPPAQSGTRSLSVINRTINWEGPGYSLLNMLGDGKSYAVSVWARVAEGTVSMQITHKRRCDGDPAAGAYTPLGQASVSTNWTLVTATLTTPPCEMFESVVYVETTEAANSASFVDFYIDNTSVEEL